MAIAYRDGRPPIAWLVANQRFWDDGYRCESCAAKGQQNDADTRCLNAVEGRGLCPATAAARIQEATEDYWVLSSDGWNTAAWLGELFKAGGVDSMKFEVVDIFDWPQRISDRQARRATVSEADVDAPEERRVASCAQACALLLLRKAPVPPHSPGSLPTVIAKSRTAPGREED